MGVEGTVLLLFTFASGCSLATWDLAVLTSTSQFLPVLVPVRETAMFSTRPVFSYCRLPRPWKGGWFPDLQASHLGTLWESLGFWFLGSI